MTMTLGGEQIAPSLRPDFPKVRQGWEAGACGEGLSELAMRPRPPSSFLGVIPSLPASPYLTLSGAPCPPAGREGGQSECG